MGAYSSWHQCVTLKFLVKLIWYTRISGSSWPLLAPPGSSWPLLAPPGPSWLLLALPALPGSSWLLLAPPGPSWPFLAPPAGSSSSDPSHVHVVFSHMQNMASAHIWA